MVKKTRLQHNKCIQGLHLHPIRCQLCPHNNQNQYLISNPFLLIQPLFNGSSVFLHNFNINLLMQMHPLVIYHLLNLSHHHLLYNYMLIFPFIQLSLHIDAIKVQNRNFFLRNDLLLLSPYPMMKLNLQQLLLLLQIQSGLRLYGKCLMLFKKMECGLQFP